MTRPPSQSSKSFLYMGCAQALSKACAPVGLVRVRVGAVVPRVRAGNVFTTRLPSSITTVLIDNSGPREILTIQDGCAHEGHWGLPVQRVTGGNVENAEDIAPGEGAVIRRGLSKIAVYRGERDALHEHSAICPHLGCATDISYTGEKSVKAAGA